MRSIFLIFWTDRPISIFRVYQFAKSCCFSPYLYNLLLLKAMFLVIFFDLEAFLIFLLKNSVFRMLQRPVSWKQRLVEQIWGQFWPPLLNPTLLIHNIFGWLKFCLEAAFKTWRQIMISNYQNSDQKFRSAILIRNSWSEIPIRNSNLEIRIRNSYQQFPKGILISNSI